MMSKLAVVEEEGDEAVYWLDLLVEASVISEAQVVGLRREFDEVVAMTVASLKTLRNRSLSTSS